MSHQTASSRLAAADRRLRPWSRFLLVSALALATLPALAADLQITDQSDTGFDPSPAGAELTYSISVENGAADTVTDAVVVFDLPAGATAGMLAPFCATAPGVPTRIVCNVGTLVGTLGPGGAPVVFPLGVDTSAMAPGIVTLQGAIGFGSAVPAPTTPVASLTDADPFFGADTNKPNNRRQETTTLVDAGNLRLEKSATPDPVVGGAVVTYTLTVTNEGPSPSTNFTVADTLPAATSYVAGSFSGAGWSFNSGSMTATNAGTLAVGASTSFSFRAQVNAGSGNIVNSAVATAIGTPDPDTNDNTAQVTTAVTPGADLTVSKSATPAPAISGQPITFTLLARNLGPSAADGVSLSDTMPAGFVIIGGTQPAGWSCVDTPDATGRTCTRATPMPAGAAETLTIEALVPADGPNSTGDVTNSATIASDTPDPNGPLLGIDNNTGSTTFTVLSDGADLSLSKQKTPALVPVWDGIGSDADSLMTSTIEVVNLGPRPATGQVQVIDHLAEGEEFISSSGPWACAVDNPYAPPPARQQVTCDLAGALPLAVGAAAPDLRIVTRAMAAGSLTNSACTGGSNGTMEPLTGGGIDMDPYPDNDCSGSGTRTTNERADLRISKQTNGPGDADNVLDASQETLTYTITVTNDGPDATAGVVVNDTIPGFVSGRTTVAATTVPAGWTCNTGNSVVCRSGTTALGNGASAVIVLTVTRALYDSAGLGAATCGGVAISNAYCNTAGVGIDATVAGSVGEIDQDNNTASDWVQVDRVANVRTTAKNITSGSPGQAGVETTYVMSFANEGPSQVPGVVFRDVFSIPANDSGFVLVSAIRTGGGSTACTAIPDPGLSVAAAAGGTSYANPTGAALPLEVRCAPLDMANGQTEALTVVIRPNVNATNTGRTFDNVASFHFDRNGDGTADPASGADASGTFDFNQDDSATDDERSATLPFTSGEVDLIVNKVDTGFTGGVDPLGYDALDPATNLITYRITVRNNGPSLATNVTIDDTIQPPAGRTVAFVGASATPGGPFDPGACTIAGGTNPVTGPSTLALECLMPGAGFTPDEPGVVRSQSTSTLYLRYLYQTPPAASGDTLENSVAARSSEDETNSANNGATQETTIRTRADMTVSKRAVVDTPDADPAVALPSATASVTLRQPFHYVIEAENNGPGASLSLDRSGSSPLDGTGTRIIDTLPGGLVVTGPITWQKAGPSPGGDEMPNGTGSCSLAGSTVTCNVGDVTVTGRVRVLIPARWDAYPAGGSVDNTATVSTEQVDAVPANNTVTVPLQVTRSSLAGVVFEDRDRAGANGGTRQAPATEPGIAGVGLVLTGTDLYGNAVNRNTSTDAGGAYAFGDLAPSDAAGYAIAETQPAGYVNGPVDPPAAGGAAPSLGGTYAAGAPDSAWSGIPVGGNDAGVRYDFPEVRRPSLSGHVYVDGNYNNVRDGGEAPIAGATVELLDAGSGVVLRTTATDAGGAYAFDDLDPLTAYTAREPLPPGNYQNRPGALGPGAIGGAPCAIGCIPGTGVAGDAATTDRISDIALDAGVDGTGFDFGEDAIAALSGTVYVDRNRNGSFDAGDAGAAHAAPNGGLAGVTVGLQGAGADGSFGTADDPVIGDAVTGADGSYVFDGLVAGQAYRIVETQPVGYGNGAEASTNQIDVVSLPVAGSTDHDFGETLGSLAGFVFEDYSSTAANNDNGSFEAGENPIANASLTLTGTDAAGNPVNATVQSGATGAYLFDELLAPLAGTTYTITQAQPAGYIDGRHTAGNATVPGNTTTANTIAGIGIDPGQQATGYLFGELANAGIGGTVYLDRNDNGTHDPGEPGISGVTVTIQGAGPDGIFGSGDDPADVVLATDGNGDYEYAGAITGRNYRVVEAQPAGHADGQENNDNQADITNLPAAGSMDNDFGELLGSIAGFVFEDFSATAANNNNGQFDPSENPIANATLTLTGVDAAGDPVNLAVQTDATGAYAFDDLLTPQPGTFYTITETQPGGYIDGQHTAGNATVPGTATITNVIDGIAIAAGEQATGYLFGELANAFIRGTVYLDRDDNGSQDPGDPGIAGVTVTIEGAGIDGAFGSVDDPAAAILTTNADGDYSYGGAVAGQDYRIIETQPPGHAEGQENPGNQIDVVNLLAAGSSDNDFGELLGSLAGVVFEDFSASAATNNNGIFDAGENPIANVTVTLTGMDAGGNPVNVSVQTDATGAFLFADLPAPQAGGYTLAETQPAGYADGRHAAGNATVPGSAATPNVIEGIGIDPGEHASGYLFGELINVAISGTVYLDRGDDGAQDAGEPGIPNVTVTIEGAGLDGIFGNGDDPAPTVLTTDADGNYNHPAAVAGQDYRIVETQPVGLADGQENASNQVDIASLPITGSSDNDFGELAASLSGNVWLDADNNGLRDAGEGGIPGVVISLQPGAIDAFGAAVPAAVTDGNGDYRFDDLTGDSYTVTQQAAQPLVGGVETLNGITVAGTIGGMTSGVATPVATVPSAIAGILLPAGGDSIGNDFGETFGVSVSGRVFLDVDNDAVQSGLEETGIAGVRIELAGTDDTGAAVSIDATTDSNGDFGFDGLRPGTYRLIEPDQPPDTSNGQTIAGSTGGTATPIATVPSSITAIDMSVPGTDSVGNLFAEIPMNSSIAGRVWLDLDNDGAIDPDEEGIAGVVLELLGIDPVGNPVSRQLSTDGDGGYLFSGLPPGTYTITEPEQPADTLDGITTGGSSGGTPSAPGSTPSTITGVALGVAEQSTGNDFGEIPAASVAGLVYNDLDNDGIPDSGETGYAAVRIVLTGTDEIGGAVELETSTDADGRYRFEGLRPGTYVVTEPEQPLQTLNGVTTAGTVDGVPVGTATPVATVPSAIAGIVLPPGAASVDNNFGEIGDSPDLVVAKSATPDTFTVNNIGRYTITVRNIGQQPTDGAYTVRDRLPAGLTLAATPSGQGWTCSGEPGDSRFECTASVVIAAGATSAATIVADVDVAASAATGTPVDNAVLVEGGGEYDYRAPTDAERTAFEGPVADLPVCDPAIVHNACRLPTPVQLSASLSGTVWFDQGADASLLDAGDSRLGGWLVEVVDAGGTVVGTATTAADGSYEVRDLVPGVLLDVRFRAPDSGIVWGLPVSGETIAGPPAPCDAAAAMANGTASSCRVRDGGSTRLSVVLEPGSDLPEQSLPLNPGGVVYDSITRTPVPGSRVILAPVGTCPAYSPREHVLNADLGGYSFDGDAISMVVGDLGFYQFLLAPEAPASCRFALTVVPPAGYVFASTSIPAEDGMLLPPPSPGEAFQVQANADAPTALAGNATTYYLELTLGSALAAPVHNHVPLDPQVAPGLVVIKSGDRKTVEVGDSMVYSITIRQTAGAGLGTVDVIDRLPHGFTYIAGTARLDGQGIADPLGAPGPVLSFDTGAYAVGAQKVLSYRVRVGVGSQQGDGVNRARAHGCSLAGGCVDPASLAPYPGGGVVASNQAEYRVVVSGGVFADEGCVLGKIFMDCNVNHVQDAEELGIPGVRMYFEDGTWLVSDSEGKYSYCGLPPASHTLKVDGSTLPVGARLVTSSNRNLGDADSLFVDLRNGELHRADFIEGSCSNEVLEQVKARRTQGEVRAPETEAGQAGLRFESKPSAMPAQGTDSARQLPIVDPRPVPHGAGHTPEGQQ